MELNVQLARYDFYEGHVWLGCFLNRADILQDTTVRAVYVSFINGLIYETPLPFLQWTHYYATQIGEPFFLNAVVKFNALWELHSHAQVDPRGYLSSFPQLTDIVSSQELGIGS